METHTSSSSSSNSGTSTISSSSSSGSSSCSTTTACSAGNSCTIGSELPGAMSSSEGTTTSTPVELSSSPVGVDAAWVPRIASISHKMNKWLQLCH